MGRTCSTNVEKNVYRILVGTTGEPLERPRRRWVDKNKIDLRAVGWHGMNWADLG
jgi:hypothetical protein